MPNQKIDARSAPPGKQDTRVRRGGCQTCMQMRLPFPCGAIWTTLEWGCDLRQVSLSEFRARGAKALTTVPAGETVLLTGQKGRAYFLVPVWGDLTDQDRELRRAMAKASLRENWKLAKKLGTKAATDREIEREIERVRKLAGR